MQEQSNITATATSSAATAAPMTSTSSTDLSERTNESVLFFPPLYVQRYRDITAIIKAYQPSLQKVVKSVLLDEEGGRAKEENGGCSSFRPMEYVCDCGCSDGGLLRYLLTSSLEPFPLRFVVGIDIDPAVLETAARGAIPDRLHGVELLVPCAAALVQCDLCVVRPEREWFLSQFGPGEASVAEFLSLRRQQSLPCCHQEGVEEKQRYEEEEEEERRGEGTPVAVVPFDVITSVEVLEHIPPPLVWNYLFNILCSIGRGAQMLILTTPNRDKNCEFPAAATSSSSPNAKKNPHQDYWMRHADHKFELLQAELIELADELLFLLNMDRYEEEATGKGHVPFRWVEYDYFQVGDGFTQGCVFYSTRFFEQQACCATLGQDAPKKAPVKSRLFSRHWSDTLLYNRNRCKLQQQGCQNRKRMYNNSSSLHFNSAVFSMTPEQFTLFRSATGTEATAFPQKCSSSSSSAIYSSSVPRQDLQSSSTVSTECVLFKESEFHPIRERVWIRVVEELQRIADPLNSAPYQHDGLPPDDNNKNSIITNIGDSSSEQAKKRLVSVLDLAQNRFLTAKLDEIPLISFLVYESELSRRLLSLSPKIITTTATTATASRAIISAPLTNTSSRKRFADDSPTTTTTTAAAPATASVASLIEALVTSSCVRHSVVVDTKEQRVEREEAVIPMLLSTIAATPLQRAQLIYCSVPRRYRCYFFSHQHHHLPGAPRNEQEEEGEDAPVDALSPHTVADAAIDCGLYLCDECRLWEPHEEEEEAETGCGE